MLNQIRKLFDERFSRIETPVAEAATPAPRNDIELFRQIGNLLDIEFASFDQRFTLFETAHGSR